MADARLEAVNRAASAMMGSAGFMLTGSKQQSDSIKRTSMTAVRASITLRKNLNVLISRFALYSKQIAKIKDTLNKTSSDKAKLSKIRAILSSGGDSYKEREAELEEKPAVAGSIGGAANAIAKGVPAALGLAGLIGLLMNPEVRKIALGFFTSFLDGLGLSKAAIDKMKAGLAVAVGIVGVYLATSVIKQVAEAFTQMKRLAQVLGLVGEVVQAKELEIELEKKKISKTREKRLKRVKSLKRLKRILSVASAAFKATLLGAAVGVAIDAVGGTLIDLSTADDEQDIDPKYVGKTIINNIVESVTFGLAKGPFDLTKKIDEAAGSERESGGSVSSLPSTEPPQDKSTAPQGQVNQKGPTVDVDVEQWHQTPGSTTTSRLSSESNMASDIEVNSVKVDQAERDESRNRGISIFNNINNSSSVVNIMKNASQGGSLVFSQSVGM